MVFGAEHGLFSRHALVTVRNGWNISDDGYLEVQKASTRFFDPKKDYLYPVPTKEIALSAGKITQNPNW